MNQRAGNRHPLLLPAGKGAAALPHHRVQALRHAGKVAEQRAVAQRPLHLFGGKLLAQRDVFPDGGVEQKDILLDVAHLLLQLLGGTVPGVNVVQPDFALIAGQPAEQNFKQGGLAASAGAGEGVFFADRKDKILSAQNRLFPVGKGNPLHPNRVVQRRQGAHRPCLLPLCCELFKVRPARCQRHAQIRKFMQAIGHAGDQVAGAHQGGHAHLALQHQQDDQNVAQDLDGHADKAHRAVSRAFTAAEVAGGLLNLVAGLTSLAQKAPLLSKKAQNIQAGQQVLERADPRRLPLGAQPSQLLQPLLKQLWQRPHDERRHKRSCHQ